MRNYFIVQAYSVLVYLSLIAFFRVVLGKSQEVLGKITGEATGIVGLEVINMADEHKGHIHPHSGTECDDPRPMRVK